MTKTFTRLARAGTLLALLVVTLGAWVRLTDAGLGCPDWPGCYGQLVVPDDPAAAAAGFSGDYSARPLQAGKAWREMIHRYLASTLGLVCVTLGVIALRNRRDPTQPVAVPLVLVALVVFQGLLGMWTVTWLLKPVVVSAHLLGGLATLSLLARLGRFRAPAVVPVTAGLSVLGVVAAGALIVQIALGGWTSANYAALACPDFPKCQTQWWPQLADFREGFVLWRGLGIDYEGGVLDHPARVAVHFAHRLGALVATVTIGAFGLALLRRRGAAPDAAAVLLLLLLQLSLGASIVLLGVPLGVAVAHNGTAALLLLAVLNANRELRSPKAAEPAHWRDYYRLTKPGVVQLLVFTAVIGMFLATPGMVPWDVLVFGSLGIAMAAGSAAVVNQLLDRRIDAQMARTRNRPLPAGRIHERDALAFALGLGLAGLAILALLVNPLTAALTFGSLIGYAVIYTAFLKHATPQNIVIGGAAGAAPPVLGWTAVTGEVESYALLLFLIVFTWTPPHFWALALARKAEYERAEVPMLPVTHGEELTKSFIFYYTILLLLVSLLPYLTGMSGVLYLFGALLLGGGFLWYACVLKWRPQAGTAMRTFGYSITYLMALFGFLLVDHYIPSFWPE